MSKFYNLLMCNSQNSIINKLNAWRNDIGENIDENDWNEACLRAQKDTINTRLKLLQYKWLTRIYITPEILHRMSANIPDTCTKCQDHKGTLIHCVWECIEIKQFWNDVINCLSEVFYVNIPLSAKLCVLGIYPDNFSRTKSQKKLLDFGLLLARRAIALNWKKMEAPSLHQWIKELSEYIGLERLTYITKGKQKDFNKLWDPYLNIIAS